MLQRIQHNKWYFFTINGISAYSGRFKKARTNQILNSSLKVENTIAVCKDVVSKRLRYLRWYISNTRKTRCEYWLEFYSGVSRLRARWFFIMRLLAPSVNLFLRFKNCNWGISRNISLDFLALHNSSRRWEINLHLEQTACFFMRELYIENCFENNKNVDRRCWYDAQNAIDGI